MAEQPRPYVLRGGQQTYPQPYDIEGVRFYSFVLDADYDALESYVDRVLNGPAGGAVVYKPLVGRVMLGLMESTRIWAGPPEKRLFSVAERDLAFWIPVVSVQKLGPIEFATRLVWYMSYVIVDDSLAVAMGREVYGFPKELGNFDQQPPVGPGGPASTFLERLKVETLAVKEYGPAAAPSFQPVVEIRRTGAEPGAAARTWETLEEAAREFLGILAGGDRVTLPGLGIVHEMFEFFEHREYPLIFLKQFRDHADGNLACYQAVVEALVRVGKFRSAGWLPGTYEVAIESYASHPIVADLGLGGGTPPVVAAAYLDFDFTMENGTLVAGG
jgi:hypothetical protein